MMQSMSKYYSLIETSGIKQDEIEKFVDWFISQNFYVTDEIMPDMFDHPKNKELFELAAKTGVLKKVGIIKCPVCGEKIGGCMDIDRDMMPEYSRCNKGHVFKTKDPTATQYIFGTKEIIPYIYY